MASPEKQHHFLVVTTGTQGQINPAGHLAVLLASHFAARVTIAIPISAHRRMFPSTSSSLDPTPLVSFATYSDGFDPNTGDGSDFMLKLRTVGPRTASLLAADLAAGGRPVTCIIYAILLSWAAEVARELKVPSFLYWTQSASVFSIYHHYFRHFIDVNSTTITIPGLPPMRPRDLPPLLLDPNPGPYFPGVEDDFNELKLQWNGGGDSKPKVLVNTFRDLEADAISAVDGIQFVAVGPMIGKAEEDSKDYMKWLDLREDRSVVYAAFGSLWTLNRRQIEEIARGLKESGRAYLWVLRGDNKEGIGELDVEEEGTVVEWCSQRRALEHRAVGCFVTHCGWNSMMEGLVGGVPMVMMPQWTDQTANARMGEEVWGVGVTAELGDDGVVVAEELKRCVEVVMGEEEKGREIRRRVAEWSEKAKEAAGEVGPAARNLKAFVEALESPE